MILKIKKSIKNISNLTMTDIQDTFSRRGKYNNNDDDFECEDVSSDECEDIETAYAREDEQFNSGTYTFQTTNKHRKIHKPVSLDDRTVMTSEKKIPTTVETPALSLPKGGWKVHKVEVPDTIEYPSVLSTKATKPKPAWTSCSKWKPVTDEFFRANEIAPPPAPPPLPVIPQRKDYPPRKEYTQKERMPATEKLPSLLKRTPQTPKSTTVQPKTAQSVAESNETYKNTRMCNFGKTCKRKECSFAHTVGEFSPVECNFQDRCKNKMQCRFKHSDETKEAYMIRSGIKF